MKETEADPDGQSLLGIQSTLTPWASGHSHGPSLPSSTRHKPQEARVTAFVSTNCPAERILGAPTLPSHSSLLELCRERGPQDFVRHVNSQPKLGTPFNTSLNS